MTEEKYCIYQIKSDILNISPVSNQEELRLAWIGLTKNQAKGTSKEFTKEET
jgi:hypothetical protein